MLRPFRFLQSQVLTKANGMCLQESPAISAGRKSSVVRKAAHAAVTAMLISLA